LKKHRHFENVEGTSSAKHASFDDRFRTIHNDLLISLSEPMKKMKVAYLRDVNKNCYKDKWLSDDMPNEPQVDLCK